MEIVNKQNTKQISNMNTTYVYTLERHELLISSKISLRETAMMICSYKGIFGCLGKKELI